MSYPKFGTTIRELTDKVRRINIEKGWRPAEGGPGANTFGDYVALLHSEVSEALEAYRDHRLADATADEPIGHGGTPILAKPEGVGSELADVLIRLVDMADVFGIDLEREVTRKIAYNRTRPHQHGGRTLADTPARPANEVAEANMVRLRFNALHFAIPDDPRGWWTGDEADRFIDTWYSWRLPPLRMSDGQVEVYLFWCSDARRAAEMLGVDLADDGGFTIEKGEYSVSIVQADEEKETKDA